MLKVTVTNPYFKKEYETKDSMDYIKNNLENLEFGREVAIKLHLTNGELVLINPENLATVEFKEVK